MDRSSFRLQFRAARISRIRRPRFLPFAWLGLLGLGLASVWVRGLRAEEAADRVTVRPADTGAALVNPDMGWTMHFYSNVTDNYGSKLEPSDTLDDFPGLSTVYLRVPWAYLEPSEGKFNWALLDTPAQRWIAKGKRIAIRVTCSENWMRFATPEWVMQAGAKGLFYEYGQGPKEDGPSWDPDFTDAVFLTKLEHFLTAMAARYDGNPNVAFLDIGTFGLWGEGHTGASSRLGPEKTFQAVKTHIDLQRRLFPRTFLCISDDVGGHDKPGAHLPETDYALAQGVGLRDDSIMVQPPPRSWFHSELAQAFWPRLPVILEHEHYGGSKGRGAWGDGSLLLKAVEDYHASFLSIHGWPREVLNENRAVIDRINQRLGYRLQLREISWPREITVGREFEIRARWANAGVAPCYAGGFPALTLKDAKGGLASVLVDENHDLRSLATAAPGQAPAAERSSRFTVGQVAPRVAAGEYSVFVSVGGRDGTPRLALPLTDDDGQHRYLLGRIQVAGK